LSDERAEFDIRNGNKIPGPHRVGISDDGLAVPCGETLPERVTRLYGLRVIVDCVGSFVSLFIT